MRAKVKRQQPNEFHFRNVMVWSCSMESIPVFVSEGTPTSVGEEGIIFLTLRNQTDKERVKVKDQTKNGNATFIAFVLNFVSMQKK